MLDKPYFRKRETLEQALACNLIHSILHRAILQGPRCSKLPSARPTTAFTTMHMSRDHSYDTFCLTHGQGGTHCHDLNFLFESQELRSKQLQQIAAVLVIDHVYLVKYDNAQVIDLTILYCRVDQRIGLCAAISQVVAALEEP